MMGPIEIIERKPLNMLEDLQTQIVHRALSYSNRAFNLPSRQPPSEQQVEKVKGAHRQDAFQGQPYGAELNQVSIDSQLNELGPQQLGRGCPGGKKQVQRKHPAVWRQRPRQAKE